MSEILPANAVLRGYFQLLSLANAVRQTLYRYEPRLYRYHCFSDETMLLHRGMRSLLRVIDAPVHDFAALGLRATADSWRQPPPDSYAAMEEVGRIMHSMEPLINIRNGALPVPDYHSLFDEGVRNMLRAIQEFCADHPVNELNMSSQQMSGVVPGATDEQINAMPVHSATREDVGQVCSICVSNFVAGQKVKILACNHRYHKDCIDAWLRNHATCPMDRSRVFFELKQFQCPYHR